MRNLQSSKVHVEPSYPGGASGPVGTGILLGEQGRRILACRGSLSLSPSNDCSAAWRLWCPFGITSTVPRVRLIMESRSKSSSGWVTPRASRL